MSLVTGSTVSSFRDIASGDANVYTRFSVVMVFDVELLSQLPIELLTIEILDMTIFTTKY